MAKHSGRLHCDLQKGVWAPCKAGCCHQMHSPCSEAVKGIPQKQEMVGTNHSKHLSIQAPNIGEMLMELSILFGAKECERQDLKLMNQWVSSHKFWEFPLEVSAFQFPSRLFLSSKQWHPPSMQGQRSETGTARLGTAAGQKEFLHPASLLGFYSSGSVFNTWLLHTLLQLPLLIRSLQVKKKRSSFWSPPWSCWTT